VTHITEVLNLEQDTVIMQDIFLFVQDGIDEKGRAFGHFESTGVRPACMSRLETAGVRLPANLFAARILGH
jgi:pilus assembly protein CpaF